jgi:hypothetical protein
MADVPRAFRTPDVRPDTKPPVPDYSALVSALKAHIETLKADLAAAELRSESQLANANARADRAIATLGMLASRETARSFLPEAPRVIGPSHREARSRPPGPSRLVPSPGPAPWPP